MALFYQGSDKSKVGRDISNLVLGMNNFNTARSYQRNAKEYARSVAQSLRNSGYANDFSEDELYDILVDEIGDTPGFWSRVWDTTIPGAIDKWGEDENYVTNIDAAASQLLQELQNASKLGAAPTIDFDAAMSEAQSAVDAEIGQQEQALADLLQQQNLAYNDAAEQVLSSDYQRNASLMGTYQSEMRRAQRNALEAGASAGARLANNINVTLSTQNRQAQQSLETSNNLAQMLLNQRQAASDIAQQRAGLYSGRAERIESLGQQKYQDQQSRLSDWETRNRDSITGGRVSNYVDSILAKRRNGPYNTGSKSSSNTGYGT